MELRIRHFEEWPGVHLSSVSSVDEARRLINSLPPGVIDEDEFHPSECEFQTVIDHGQGIAYIEAVWSPPDA